MTSASEPLIGVLNAGSSSVKFSFYDGEQRLLSGQVDAIGVNPKGNAEDADGKPVAMPGFGPKPPTVPSEVLPVLMPWVRAYFGNRRVAALGHRVVHGGL